MKGLDMSLGFVVALAIGLLVVAILVGMVNANILNLENFALNNTGFGVGG